MRNFCPKTGKNTRIPADLEHQGVCRPLERILVALERELLEATDEEILDAARELGMNPATRGSSAFFGLKYSYALHMLGVDGMQPWPRAGGPSEGSRVRPRRPKDEPPTGP